MSDGPDLRFTPAPAPRLEDERLLTGRGRFLADLWKPGVLRCAFARSPVAHGRVTGITLDEARATAGVVAVFTAADLDLRDIPGGRPPGPDAPAMTRPALATDRVRYVGEPLAVVVAENARTARDAADLVWADFEELPVVVDPTTALNSETLLFPAAATNAVVDHEVSVQGTDESDYPVNVSVEVANQRLAPVPIEPLGILAEPTGDDGLHVWCGHQAPHRLSAQLAALLGLDGEHVRVTVPEVGGAFGMKGMFYPEYLVVGATALRLGRPVMWVETRREQFLGGTHGRGQIHRVELSGDTAGRIRRARIHILGDAGAYPHNGSLVPMLSRFMATGPYDIADVTVETTIVVTNRAPTGSYRGAGRPEAAYAMERAVEAFSRAAGLDPAEVRITNFIPPGSMPYRTRTGALYDGGDYREALRTALDLAEADGVREEQHTRLEQGRDPIGLGIGAFVERAGGTTDSGEYARVEITEDGEVVVHTGSTASGQGHETVWTQLAGQALTVPPEQVRVIAGDTGVVASGIGTFASRSAQIGGSAIWRMAHSVRERARRVAASMLEAAPEDLILRDGRFSVVGVPGSEVGLGDVARKAIEDGAPLSDSETYRPGAQTFPYGVHVAVVEVELATGTVTVLRLVAVDDCGVVLNPTIVEGQIHGSLVQGLGQAMWEGIVYDESGQPLTSSLMDYAVPLAEDIPPLLTGRLVTPAPSNPLGAKGTGEAGCIGAPPAIVNAVLDALAPWGVTDLDMPLLPPKVWAAIHRTAPSGEGGVR